VVDLVAKDTEAAVVAAELFIIQAISLLPEQHIYLLWEQAEYLKIQAVMLAETQAEIHCLTTCELSAVVQVADILVLVRAVVHPVAEVDQVTQLAVDRKAKEITEAPEPASLMVVEVEVEVQEQAVQMLLDRMLETLAQPQAAQVVAAHLVVLAVMELLMRYLEKQNGTVPVVVVVANATINTVEAVQAEPEEMADILQYTDFRKAELMVQAPVVAVAVLAVIA
jgi:hypothetical protein